MECGHILEENLDLTMIVIQAGGFEDIWVLQETGRGIMGKEGMCLLKAM